MGINLITGALSQPFTVSLDEFLPVTKLWLSSKGRLLVSQDVCTKLALRFYSSGGYAHILRNVKPKMLEKGMTDEQISTILIKNPKLINILY